MRGHEGPCAAVESPDDAKLVADAMERLKDKSDPLAKLTAENERLGLYDDMGAPAAPLSDAEIRDMVTDWFDNGKSEIKRGMYLARDIERAAIRATKGGKL